MGRNRCHVRTIIQVILFKDMSPDLLYDTYLNAEKHSQSLGGIQISISDRIGADFSIYGHYVQGRNIDLIKNKLIVQRWRAADWDESNMDSIVTIQLQKQDKDTLLILVHANIPIENLSEVKRHWEEFYWKRWRKYFEVSINHLSKK